jgi:hypothetical protein
VFYSVFGNLEDFGYLVIDLVVDVEQETTNGLDDHGFVVVEVELEFAARLVEFYVVCNNLLCDLWKDFKSYAFLARMVH